MWLINAEQKTIMSPKIGPLKAFQTWRKNQQIGTAGHVQTAAAPRPIVAYVEKIRIETKNRLLLLILSGKSNLIFLHSVQMWKAWNLSLILFLLVW